MDKFKEFINEKESVKDTIGNNTLVLAKKDGKTFSVSKCGKNCTFTTVGSTFNIDNIRELSGKGWEVRYADTLPTKQDGPKSSGIAGKPQKD